MTTRPSGRGVVIWPVRPAAVGGGGLIEGDGYGVTVELDTGVPVEALREPDGIASGFGDGVVIDGAQVAEEAETANTTKRMRHRFCNDLLARASSVFMLGAPTSCASDGPLAISIVEVEEPIVIDRRPPRYQVSMALCAPSPDGSAMSEVESNKRRGNWLVPHQRPDD